MKTLNYIISLICLPLLVFTLQPNKESDIPIPLIEPIPIEIPVKKVIPVVKKPVVTLASLYVEPTGEALEIAIYISEQSGAPLDIIKKIMWAESQYVSDAKGTNKNGSYDTGYMQINSQHIALAKSMDIDIFTPYGNADFAIYLISKNGLRDWGYSKSTWSNI